MKNLLNSVVKYFFVGGKGGVGKTVIATAVALYFAEKKNEKVLLASFNPVHSLSTIFNQDLSGGIIKQVSGVSTLHALEVEIESIVEKYKDRTMRLFKELFKWAELSVDIKPIIDTAVTNPSFHEAAVFDRMMDVIINEGQKYSRIIFDMAAVANAVRLIGLSKIYGLWLQRTIKMRQESLSLKYQLSFRKEKVAEEIKKDPVLLDLLDIQKRYLETRGFITNPNLTRFIFVTIPTVLSISVVKRFMQMVKAYDIPLGGVVVNMLIPEEEAVKDTSGFLRTKYEEQDRNLKIIDQEFKDMVLARIRLFPEEIVGLERLRMFVEEMVK